MNRRPSPFPRARFGPIEVFGRDESKGIPGTPHVRMCIKFDRRGRLYSWMIPMSTTEAAQYNDENVRYWMRSGWIKDALCRMASRMMPQEVVNA